MDNETIKKPKDLAALLASWDDLEIDFSEIEDELPPTDENLPC